MTSALGKQMLVKVGLFSLLEMNGQACGGHESELINHFKFTFVET